MITIQSAYFVWFQRTTYGAYEQGMANKFDWHEVTQVEHYYLSVEALTQPIQVREGPADYGGLP